MNTTFCIMVQSFSAGNNSTAPLVTQHIWRLRMWKTDLPRHWVRERTLLYARFLPPSPSIQSCTLCQAPVCHNYWKSNFASRKLAMAVEGHPTHVWLGGGKVNQPGAGPLWDGGLFGSTPHLISGQQEETVEHWAQTVSSSL